VNEITIIIPTRNEAEKIAECVVSANRLGSVVILDSKSTDGTAEIARSLGAKVVQFDWNGTYPKKRNWFLINNKSQLDWVLFLDADEILTDAAVEEIKEKINDTSKVGFYLKYRIEFEGKYLRYGVKQRKLALFRASAGLYEKIEDKKWSRFDMEVHEHPVLNGELGTIKCDLLHNEYKGRRVFFEKHLEYAKWEAQRYQKITENNPKDLNFRQKIKYRFLGKWWFSHAYLLVGFIFLGGFLDGITGLKYLSMKKWYFKTIYLLIQGDKN